MLGADLGLFAYVLLGQVFKGIGISGYFLAFLFAGMTFLAIFEMVHIIMLKINPYWI